MPTTRVRILDAAEACLRRDGIRRTTVAGVADEAGLSRAYVYRFFADKSTLLSAALIRRDEAFWAEANERIAAAPDVELARKLRIQEYQEELMHPYYAAERGLVDDVIEPALTRSTLINAFEMLRAKNVSLPARKHGNPPI